VRLGPLPDDATLAMRNLAEDIALRLGLLLAEGVTRALPYATSEAVRFGHVTAKSSASYLLHRLEDADVIRCVGEMPLRGKGNGTKLFVPPGWRPLDPKAYAVAVELGNRAAVADLVWVPDEPADVPAVETKPAGEVVDEQFVGGGGSVVRFGQDALPESAGDVAGRGHDRDSTTIVEQARCGHLVAPNGVCFDPGCLGTT
jgi:hypothetical protein